MPTGIIEVVRSPTELVNTIPRIFIFKGGDQPVKTFAFPPHERDLVSSINSVLG